jgi:hypothetical protein
MASGTLTANGTTTEVALVKPTIHVSGNFGGGTITFQFQDESLVWRNISTMVLTAPDDSTLDYARAINIRGSLSGATSPSLFWSIR